MHRKTFLATFAGLLLAPFTRSKPVAPSNGDVVDVPLKKDSFRAWRQVKTLPPPAWNGKPVTLQCGVIAHPGSPALNVDVVRDRARFNWHSITGNSEAEVLYNYLMSGVIVMAMAQDSDTNVDLHTRVRELVQQTSELAKIRLR